MSLVTDGPKLLANERLEDISSLISEAAEQLPSDGIALFQNFSLNDSLSAFELGVPQMDTGAAFVPLEDELAPLEPLQTSQELEVVVEELVSAYISWLDGYLLQQTLLANLRVESIATRLLILKGEEGPGTSNLALTQNKARFVGTEMPDVQKFLESVATKISSSKVNLDDLLDAFILCLLRTCSLTVALITEANEVVHGEEDFSNDSDAFYLLSETPVYIVETLCTKTMAAAQKLCAPSFCETLNMLRCWIDVLAAVVSGQASGTTPRELHLGIKAPKLSETDCKQRKEIIQRVAPFSAGVQSRMKLACLTRKLVDLATPEEAFEKWTKQWKQLSQIHLGYDFAASNHSALNFYANAASQDYPPVVRAALFLKLLGPNAPLCPLPPVMDKSFSASLLASVYHLQQQIVTSWLELLACLCQNRCRQADNLAQYIPVWEKISQVATETDVLTNNKTRFGPWCKAHLMRIRRWLFLSHIELRTAAAWEMPYIYWALVNESSSQTEADANLAGGQPAVLEFNSWKALANAQFLLLTIMEPVIKALKPPTSIAADRSQRSLVFDLRFQFLHGETVITLDEFEHAQAQVRGSDPMAVLTEVKALAKMAQEQSKGDLRLLRSSVMTGVVVMHAIKTLGQWAPESFTIQWEQGHSMFPTLEKCN